MAKLRAQLSLVRQIAEHEGWDEMIPASEWEVARWSVGDSKEKDRVLVVCYGRDKQGSRKSDDDPYVTIAAQPLGRYKGDWELARVWREQIRGQLMTLFHGGTL